MSKLSRYNEEKRGSFKIALEFNDWELSITIGCVSKAIKEWGEIERANPNDKKVKAHLSYLRKLRQKYSRALGQVLKAEFRDLKLKKGQKEL